MALNPVAYTDKVVRSFLRYQLTAYPFAAPHLHAQMKELLSLDETRRSPLLKGPYISLSRPFRPGAALSGLVAEGLLHPHLVDRLPEQVTRLYGHQEKAIRAVAAGKTTLVSTGTGSGKTECFLYPVVSRCLELRDEGAAPGISAVIVYPMNALADDQLMRLRSLLAGTRIPFGLYVGKTPETEAEVAGVALPAGSSREDYLARLGKAQRAGKGETVCPAEEARSREAMRTAGRQPRILLTNVKQLELLLTRQQDAELFRDARLDYLVFDEAHTFTGAFGAETACLIRRLRAYCRAAPDETTGIATSATIVDSREPDAARRFASRFFGVPAEEVETVAEDYEEEVWAEARSVPKAPAGDTGAILERAVRAVEGNGEGNVEGNGEGNGDAAGEVAAVYRSLAGAKLPVGGGGAEAEWPAALHGALSRSEFAFGLSEELAVARPLAELPEALGKRLGRPVTEAEILAWLTLGAAARSGGRPLLRPVLHLFARGIGGAVVSFPDDSNEPKLWLAAEDIAEGKGKDPGIAHFPLLTCTTCGQHYFEAFLKDFEFTAKRPGGGEAGADGTVWPRLERAQGGKRAVLFDRLIGSEEGEDGGEEGDGDSTSARAAPLFFCRRCGAAHPDEVSRCRACGAPGAPARLNAVRSKKGEPGSLTSCVSCGAPRGRAHGRPREPARPVRAVTVADVHVLTQDLVHHADRRRLLVFCDNRQDAAFQAGWMRDHARRFRLRALMAEGMRKGNRAVSDLVRYLDQVLEADEALSRALIPEVWAVERLAGSAVGHGIERKKYLRIQVLREVTVSSRQAIGLEPWGRMRVDYEGLDDSDQWIADRAHTLGVAPNRLRDGIAGALDYLRRKRVLHDAEGGIFSRYWMEGDREIQRGYLPHFGGPTATKLRREPGSEMEKKVITPWLTRGGDTTMRQLAVKWGAERDAVEPLLTDLFDFLVDRGLLKRVQLLGAKGRRLPGVTDEYQVDANRLLLTGIRGVHRCRKCRRRFAPEQPRDICPAWRCRGKLEWMKEETDNYDLALLDGAYSMLRPAEHTAMVPNDERERLENLFKGGSEAVNCLVCTPTLELGIDIGRLDSVLMRNVPPLPANYWQRAGRAGRRHRMAVDLTYCRPVSHDRAYFDAPEKLLSGRIDPPAFHLRNGEMVAKQVHATVIARLHRIARDPARPEEERGAVRAVLDECLPRRVTPYLFDGRELRSEPFDFTPLRRVIERNAEDLEAEARRVFEQGWPEDASVLVTPERIAARVAEFPDRLEEVVRRLARRLDWAMRQIRRLSARRSKQGTLDPADESLFRRCDSAVRRLKGAKRGRKQAEGHDDSNTFSVLAAEGFLPGYGLEVGSVIGYAEVPSWFPDHGDFTLPRPPSAAVREYVPGNLIYANGRRFVARRFRREPGEEREETAYYEVSTERQALRPSVRGEGSLLAGQSLPTISVCDTDLIHASHISDEEEHRFQLPVAVYGIERNQHDGGKAFRWGPQPVFHRRGVRLRLVNVGVSGDDEGRGLGYPLCVVCGQSVSPFSSERQRRKFREDHAERCGRAPKNTGFYADAVADALSLPECEDAETAYGVLEALRLAAARCLDMHREDLQILVIGDVVEDHKNALLWDPMPGGSGLLDRLLAGFGEIAEAAREIVSACPAVCEASCVDCLQYFRNAYYHRHLDRRRVIECFDQWGTGLAETHQIPPSAPAPEPEEGAVPVNEAETRLQRLLRAAGFGEGVRGEQIRLGLPLGGTTPDVIYRTGEPDEGVCIYLDGLSRHLHGNPETAEKDGHIRSRLRSDGWEVLEITAHQLHDRDAMERHFRRLANYLSKPDLRRRLRDNPNWFPSDESSD